MCPPGRIALLVGLPSSVNGAMASSSSSTLILLRGLQRCLNACLIFSFTSLSVSCFQTPVLCHKEVPSITDFVSDVNTYLYLLMSKHEITVSINVIMQLFLEECIRDFGKVCHVILRVLRFGFVTCISPSYNFACVEIWFFT